MSTLFAILSSLISVYTVCHSQSDQGLHYLPISAVWSGSTLFALVLSSIMKVYTVCHSQQSDEGLHCDSQQFDQCLHYLQFSVWSSLHYLPFSVVWSGSTLFALVSKKYYQCLHCLPFSAVWSGSTLLAILSSLIKVKYYTVILRNSLNRFYTICHSQQSDQGLHCLPFSAVWSGSTLFAILSSLIKVKVFIVILRNSLIKIYTICHSNQSDEGLHCLPFSAV